MERLGGLVLVLLGFVVLANAGPVGLWTLLYVNTTQPQHNGTHINILKADMQCVVEEGDKFLNAPLDQCTSLPGARPAYGELRYGALLDRYSSALVNAYLVGFALPGYTERPDFNLVRYAFKYVKDYFYYEYQGRLILNEVETRAWGVLPRSDYCNTDSPFQALLTDVVAYMYNTWGIKISNESLLYIYLVGNLPCFAGNLGGAYGVATVKTPYGSITVRAVVILHSSYNLRNLHLATLATYGALETDYFGSVCIRPPFSENDGPLLMSRWSYWAYYAWPDGVYGTPLPFMIPAFLKPWLTGIRVNMSALIPDRIYTWELNSPTRFVNATYLSFSVDLLRTLYLVPVYVPLHRWYYYDVAMFAVMPVLCGPPLLYYMDWRYPLYYEGYAYWDGVGVYRWRVYVARLRATLGRLWTLCQGHVSYNVGERAAAIDTIGALVVASRLGVERRAWARLPWSYLDSAVLTGEGINWYRLSLCHISMGGPLANRVTEYFNPPDRVAPNGMPFYYDSGAGGIRDARTGQLYTGSNVFLVAVVNETAVYDLLLHRYDPLPHRLVVLAWGNGGDGTYASGVWLRDFFWQALNKYAAVVRWVDTNGDGIPDGNDKFEVLATWP
ncbi:MAG: hypothetical protein ACO2PN_18525 [Pyrobaculum sp.]|jgi:hypothetical protein